MQILMPFCRSFTTNLTETQGSERSTPHVVHRYTVLPKHEITIIIFREMSIIIALRLSNLTTCSPKLICEYNKPLQPVAIIISGDRITSK